MVLATAEPLRGVERKIQMSPWPMDAAEVYKMENGMDRWTDRDSSLSLLLVSDSSRCPKEIPALGALQSLLVKGSPNLTDQAVVGCSSSS